MMQYRHPVDGQMYPIQVLGKTVPVVGNLCFRYEEPEKVMQVRSIEIQNHYCDGTSCQISAENTQQIVVGDIRHFAFAYEQGVVIRAQTIQFFDNIDWDDLYDQDRDKIYLRDFHTVAQRKAHQEFCRSQTYLPWS